MSKVKFNDDISLSIPYGWGSETKWEDGKSVLRIAGPGAGAYLSNSSEYECDISLSVSKEVDSPLEDMNFSERLREISDKAPDIQISVSVSSSFGSSHSSQVGGSGFNRERRAVIDRPDLKAGYFSLGILGKTACIGVIITSRYLYMLTPLKSGNVESARRYLPDILGSVELLLPPLSPQEREKQRKEQEKQRKEREKAEKERQEREAAERRRREKEAQEKKREIEKKKAAYEKAVADFNRKEKEIKDRRHAELAAALAEMRNGLETQARSLYAEEIYSIEKSLKDFDEARHQAEEKLKALGAFRFRDKREQKARVRAAEDRILGVGERLEAAEKAYRGALAGMENTVRTEEGRIRSDIEKRLPMPKRPLKCAYIPYQETLPDDGSPAARNPMNIQVQNELFRKDVLEWMEPDKRYSLQDIHEGVPSIIASGISPGRVSTIVADLVSGGWVEKETAAQSVWYRLM